MSSSSDLSFESHLNEKKVWKGRRMWLGVRRGIDFRNRREEGKKGNESRPRPKDKKDIEAREGGGRVEVAFDSSPSSTISIRQKLQLFDNRELVDIVNHSCRQGEFKGTG